MGSFERWAGAGGLEPCSKLNSVILAKRVNSRKYVIKNN